MKLQTRSFVVRKPETIDITAFFKKFCIATRTRKSAALARERPIFGFPDTLERACAASAVFRGVRCIMFL